MDAKLLIENKKREEQGNYRNSLFRMCFIFILTLVFVNVSYNYKVKL